MVYSVVITVDGKVTYYQQVQGKRGFKKVRVSKTNVPQSFTKQVEQELRGFKASCSEVSAPPCKPGWSLKKKRKGPSCCVKGADLKAKEKLARQKKAAAKLVEQKKAKSTMGKLRKTLGESYELAARKRKK
jgi:hypothetical protein